MFGQFGKKPYYWGTLILLSNQLSGSLFLFHFFLNFAEIGGVANYMYKKTQLNQGSCPSYWQPTGTYSLNMANSDKFFSKYYGMVSWGHFLPPPPPKKETLIRMMAQVFIIVLKATLIKFRVLNMVQVLGKLAQHLYHCKDP